jgi:uncharacterized protein (DUF4415 family)
VAKELKGVKSVLGGLLGPAHAAKSEESEPKALAAEPDPAPQAVEPSGAVGTAERARPTRTAASAKPHAARRGRPPGRGAGEGGEKEKVTLRINKELMDKFRDRSWDERCQVGELVEQAMQGLAKQWAKQAKE